MNRRSILKVASLLPMTALLSSQSVLANIPGNKKSSAKVLVLGGRDFFGPTMVETLLKRNHKVTLFNRGLTNPQLFPQLKLVKGNRELPADEGLATLAEHLKTNTYDWVIDTWQKSPVAVAKMAKLLKGKIGLYQYVSSIAVYRCNG